jgi:hypothetical protein
MDSPATVLAVATPVGVTAAPAVVVVGYEWQGHRRIAQALARRRRAATDHQSR